MEVITTFKVYSTITGVLGIFLNAILLYLAVFKSPSTLKSYSILIINFAITDLLASIFTLIVMARLVPMGTATAQISYGLCTLFGPTVCYIGYRYYILENPSPKVKTIVGLISIIYLPALFHASCFMFNQSDAQAVMDIYLELYPNDTIVLNQVTGNLDTTSFTATFPVLHMVLSPIPITISILIIRRKIIKVLQKTMEHLRKETKALHKQLLTALTIQAGLPAFFALGVFMFALEGAGLVQNPGIECIISASECIIPVLSPIVYLYFVSPYRRALLKITGNAPTVSVSEVTITVTSNVQKEKTITTVTN
ncbi:unnamed protein product [Caenorhabditis angaria]|uniref:G-protein coupled receptors family 1 profile domain-containing protein n=1 Tax=Caenorhabditis angaria TaxID=860376 RepID=A0A9P1N8P3_9PELO|nr:unnamed protein product [Caenorhabditis angaria]